MSKVSSDNISVASAKQFARIRSAVADLLDRSAAVLRPDRRAVGRPLAADDPFWELVGSATSQGAGDASADKHRYLVEAYEAEAAEGLPQPQPPDRAH